MTTGRVVENKNITKSQFVSVVSVFLQDNLLMLIRKLDPEGTLKEGKLQGHLLTYPFFLL